MHRKFIGSVGLMGSATLILCTGYASTASAQSDSGVALEEIIITAEHRTEDIQKTAIPMTAITGAQIAAKGQTSLDEVLRDAPSLKIQSSPQGVDIVMRGVGGNAAGGISQDPDVSVFTDGIYSSLGAQNIGNIYDVQRVEVLRGPQGTLYGRNSAGGAVNILTNDPGAEFGAGINAGVGSLNLRRADGFVNLPVSSTFGIRLAFDRDLRDGYYQRSNLPVLQGTNLDGRAGEVDNTGIRVKAKWTPSDAFSLLARIDYARQKGLTQTTVPIKDSGAPPPFLPANPADPWDPNTAGPLTSAPVGNDNKFYTYSLQADADLGFGVLTVIPTYTDGTQFQYGCGGLFAPASAVCTDASTITTKQSTVEARVASEATSALKWVAGIYYLDSKSDQSGMAPGASATWYALQANNKRPASSYAGFAQATIPFTDTLRGTLGGRYTVDEKKVFYGVCSSTDGLTCGPSANGAGTYVSPAGNRSNKYNSFTYKAGLEYDLGAAAMVYVQASKGYKAGGFSTATFPPVAYDPEGLINYEVGIKSRMLDNRLELNADVYFYQYHNQQIELHVSSPWTGIIPDQYVPADYLPGGSLANTNDLILDVNAGNSQYKGFELQAKYQLTAHDQFNLEAAYNRAVYGHFVVPIASGPPGIDYGSATSYDLTGKQEAHAPLWSGNVGYQHAWDIAGGSLTLQGNMRLQTSNYATIQQWFANGNTVQKGYHQTDANLRYAAAGDKWSVGIWGKNLENNEVVTYVYPLFKQTLDISRTYGATASIRF